MNLFRWKLRAKSAILISSFTLLFVGVTLFASYQFQYSLITKNSKTQTIEIYKSMEGQFKNLARAYWAVNKKNAELKRKPKSKSIKKKRKTAVNKRKNSIQSIKDMFRVRPDNYKVLFVNADWQLMARSHDAKVSSTPFGERIDLNAPKFDPLLIIICQHFLKKRKLTRFQRKIKIQCKKLTGRYPSIKQTRNLGRPIIENVIVEKTHQTRYIVPVYSDSTNVVHAEEKILCVKSIFSSDKDDVSKKGCPKAELILGEEKLKTWQKKWVTQAQKIKKSVKIMRVFEQTWKMKEAEARKKKQKKKKKKKLKVKKFISSYYSKVSDVQTEFIIYNSTINSQKKLWNKLKSAYGKWFSKKIYNQCRHINKLGKKKLADKKPKAKKNRRSKKHRKTKQKCKIAEDLGESKQLTVERAEMKQIKTLKIRVRSSLSAFDKVYAEVQGPSTAWENILLRNEIYYKDTSKLANLMLKKLFFGVAEIRLSLAAQVETIQTATFKLSLLGGGLVILVAVIAYFFAGFLVRNIKSLAETALQVEKGDLDSRFEVSSHDELRDLADSFNSMVKGLRHRSELMSDILVAQKVQQTLLPHKISNKLKKKFNISFDYRATSRVGGDFIDFFSLGPGKTMVAMGDVSNHGLGPSLVMVMLRTALRSFSQADSDLKKLVKKLNAMLLESTPDEIFVTLFMGIIDSRKKQLTFTSCGHNPGYLLSGEKLTRFHVQGVALGILDDDFLGDIETKTITFEEGDSIFLYTDGLTEAFNKAEEQFGEKRLETFLKKTAARQDAPAVLIRNLVQLVFTFASDGENTADHLLHDDLAVILVQRT